MTARLWNANDAGKPARLSRAIRGAFALLAVVLVLLAAGFAWFLSRMPSDEVALQRDADGIVQ